MWRAKEPPDAPGRDAACIVGSTSADLQARETTPVQRGRTTGHDRGPRHHTGVNPVKQIVGDHGHDRGCCLVNAEGAPPPSVAQGGSTLGAPRRVEAPLSQSVRAASPVPIPAHLRTAPQSLGDVFSPASLQCFSLAHPSRSHLRSCRRPARRLRRPATSDAVRYSRRAPLL